MPRPAERSAHRRRRAWGWRSCAATRPSAPAATFAASRSTWRAPWRAATSAALRAARRRAPPGRGAASCAPRAPSARPGSLASRRRWAAASAGASCPLSAVSDRVGPSGPHPGVEHRPYLGLAFESGPVLAVQLHELGCDPERLGLRLGLQDRPAADDLLALGERAVGHGDLAVGEPHTRAFLAR